MRKIWKKTENGLLNILNMGLSILAGVCVGMILGYFGTSRLMVCGAVAITSTIAEHFLTIYPIPFFHKEDKNEDENEDESIKEIL